MRGLLASSLATVSAAGSDAGVATGEGADAKLSPLEMGAGSRTVDRRRGASGTGMDGSGMSGAGMTGAGVKTGDAVPKSATVSGVTGSSACG
ncbi:MAG: hypothetical protein ABSE50_11610, partial [Xanthobacteraceae bacterium]